jgi:molybdopterin-guanine dinucleotide biosynthesis protein A
LAAGLAALEGHAKVAYVTACDTPFLQPGWVPRLVSLLGDADACVPWVEGRDHPLAAVYRCAVRPVVEDQLAARRLRLIDLLGRLSVRRVSAGELRDVDPNLLSLRNLNTPAEYAAALALRRAANEEDAPPA